MPLIVDMTRTFWPEQPCSYAVGDWVLVTYDGYGKSYSVEITEVHESSLQINVMERTGGNFKWPKREDSKYHVIENGVKSLNHPIVVGNRGQFKSNDGWTASVDISLSYNQTNMVSMTNKI